ncbi:hypothetical protein ACIQHV_30795 [Bacillus bombysepticus]|uniref:Uncharacterized protein n=1 Tax=Bacillus thuringiensis serovar kumamotoensis TaxID=132267 RepID=A0A9X6JQS6_BACUK|nr:hypothetical protein [Bacillus thuringiensis]MEC2872572.1 hypothetical protein [Bacillus cereus]OTZ72929.1 hypothetical protein BK769_15085 [Bacillus thuringiensis serovar kumamtoensis]
MQSLKLLKFNICIFGILFITYCIGFFSEFITEHTFNWFKGIAAIGFLFVLMMNSLDLKDKNYKTT